MRPRLDILICGGGACISSHSREFKNKLTEEINEKGLPEEVNLIETGCMGPCQLGPVMVVYPDGSFYINLKEEHAEQIVLEHFLKGRPVQSLLWVTPEARKLVEEQKQVPFFEKQKKIVLALCGRIDPENIEEYIAQRGYEALGTILVTMKPEEVIDIMAKSGLRGRGGAGFPTGLKWKFARQNPTPQKFVICNADEGDPGAFMNRSVLEGDPHSVLDGMAIAGYAIGTPNGYIYVRAEYPLAVKRLRIAIDQAKKLNLLGPNILGSNFSFDIEIMQGAGAFVCGEGSALMYSIEGKRGMPRVRPPRSVESGLWGMPTSLNNVETFANVPNIVVKGGEWFAKLGTENSKGTKTFALTGKISRPGLIEVPLGIHLRQIVYDIGGGIPHSKTFKAIQTGGPSGGCLPTNMLDTPVDYETLGKVGSIMGSGGMVVMDTDTCMVDTARYFLAFCRDESCGKCVPCREGLPLMIDIMERITQGKGKPEDIDRLNELGKTIIASALCGLGTSAPNPVLSSIRYFREEWEAHVNEKRCPALVCKELINFYILPDKCAGCGICVRACPVDAITGGKRMVHIIDQSKCIKCGTCLEKCPAKFSAVKKVSAEIIEVPKEPVPVAAGVK